MSSLLMVPLVDVQVNPENPVHRAEDVADLAVSVAEVGVLLPVVLRSAELFGGDSRLTGEPWVVLAGHRRVAAAREAGLSEVPAVVRDDLEVSRLQEVMLHENLHRMELSPVEEARSFASQLELTGLSQRSLAARLGVSQGRISQRLALLELPESLLLALHTGDLSVTEVRRVSASAEVWEQIAQEWRPGDSWTDVVQGVVEAAEYADAVASAQERAAAEGVAFVVEAPFESRIYGDEIEHARADGELAYMPGTADVPQPVRVLPSAELRAIEEGIDLDRYSDDPEDSTGDPVDERAVALDAALARTETPAVSVPDFVDDGSTTTALAEDEDASELVSPVWHEQVIQSAARAPEGGVVWSLVVSRAVTSGRGLWDVPDAVDVARAACSSAGLGPAVTLGRREWIEQVSAFDSGTSVGRRVAWLCALATIAGSLTPPEWATFFGEIGFGRSSGDTSAVFEAGV